MTKISKKNALIGALEWLEIILGSETGAPNGVFSYTLSDTAREFLKSDIEAYKGAK